MINVRNLSALFGNCLLLQALVAGAQENRGNMAIGFPRSFEAIAVSPSEIRCYWMPVEGATGYRIERDGQTIATLPSTAQEFDDAGLQVDSVHQYTVRTLQSDTVSAPQSYTERTFAPFPDNELSPALSHSKGRRETFNAPAANTTFDVVVVQASTGGVAAAIEAARRGLKVALIEPTTRLGGMSVNGLSATDLRRPAHASGFLVRFRDRVASIYAKQGIKTNGLAYSPGVAHQAMKSLLWEQSGITVFRRSRLAHVETSASGLGEARRINSIVIEELNPANEPTGRHAKLYAKVFVDATDCGDLTAWAGAPFCVGREPRSRREPHNGVIYYDRANDKPLPGSTGKGDRRIQSYAYLLTVKDYGPGADKTIPKPDGYRKDDFIHSPAWNDSWAVTSGKMPDGKYELNQHPQGNDLQVINYSYPTAGYAARARIEKLYRDHVLGYLYYIQTELGQKQIGLPDDDYRDSGGFPSLLYIREGRRMLGEQLPDESDISDAQHLIRPESVGLGDYPMDSHAVEIKKDWDRPDMGEGEWWLYRETPTHSLPLGIMIPKGLDNVFVTTAVSSTHVSFGTYRLEPVRMALGEASGVAASLCIRYLLAGRDVPVRQIQDALLPEAGNPLADPHIFLSYLSDVKQGSPYYRAIQYLTVRGFQLTAEELKPNAPTTRGQLSSWLARLAERAAPPSTVIERSTTQNGKEQQVVRRAYYPYLGAPANWQALKALQQTPDQDKVVTRAEIAHWLTQILGWKPPTSSSGRYAALSDPKIRADAEALAAHNIDAVLWDNWSAYLPDGTLAFQPDVPLTHEQMFETLYIAQIGLGPLFNDNPVDGRNGRTVPSALFETVVER